MVQVLCNREVITFNSVEEIREGLKKRGNRLLAAIEAAGRYPYPSDHEDDRAEIIEEINLLGQSTNSRDTWDTCVAALYLLDIVAATKLQSNPPTRRVTPVSIEAPSADQQRIARRTYPYSALT